jgi:hypothetical protein
MAGLVGTEAIVNDLNSKISNGLRYANNIDDPEKKAGAEGRVAEWQDQLTMVLGMDPEYDQGSPAPEPSSTALSPSLTGSMAIDQANILSNILNSPLYTEELKSSYLETYLPGLTRANFDINAAKASELENEVSRRQYQADAIRNVAGDYASRGMRTPEMANRGFAPIQKATEQDRTSAERNITGLEQQKDIFYGAGAEDGETFISDPTKFGSVGQGARSQAVRNLQQLPGQYGLTQVENENTSPMPNKDPNDYKPPKDTVLASGLTRAQLMAKIDAGKEYRKSMAAKGKQKFVDGADKKIQTYQDEVDAFDGGY